ncbi:MAG: SH3 domain-containing protein [Gammaproteobacteria bacterium]|nr:MAG: SH3 domain-containing protein [Gammaproteobacteria bacterium]
MIKRTVSACLLLISSAAIAETGDLLPVIEDGVKVRAKPSDSAKVTGKLGKGAEVMEMAVEGDWYEIYDADNDISGWVNKSVLKVSASAASKPASASTAKMFQQFEKEFKKYNERVKSLKGYTPFVDAKPGEEDEMVVTVTDEWKSKRRSSRKATLMAVHRRWENAVGYEGVVVRAIDESGKELMNYSN